MCILQSINLNTSSSKKKILTQGKLSRFIQITLCKCQFMKKCERKEGEKKNTIGSAIQAKVKDVHGGDWFGWGECPHLISLDSLGHQWE